MRGRGEHSDRLRGQMETGGTEAEGERERERELTITNEGSQTDRDAERRTERASELKKRELCIGNDVNGVQL